MKASTIRDLNDEELMQMQEDLHKKLFDLHVRKGMGDSSDQPLLVRMVRRDVARAKTVARERGVSG